jgi:hypothetical protein
LRRKVKPLSKSLTYRFFNSDALFESLLAFIDFDNGLIVKLTKLSKDLRQTVQNLLRHKTIQSVSAYNQAYEQFSTVKRTWLTLTEVSHGVHRLDRVLLC